MSVKGGAGMGPATGPERAQRASSCFAPSSIVITKICTWSQILLPLYEKGGKRIGRPLFRATAKALAKEFGRRYRIHPRAGGRTLRGSGFDGDDIVVYEVMADKADRAFWRTRRCDLQKAFGQDEIVVRAVPAKRL
jgi:hypothetical protein